MGVKEGLITLLLGTPGQLYTRIQHLNGSLDKPWLLLFLFFPLSIVSSIWFFAGWVDEGQGSDPVDEWMYILPISSVIFTFIFYNLCDTSDMISTPLILIFNIVTFAASRVMRKSKDCPNKENLSYGRSVSVGIIASIIALATNLLSTFLSYIPFIGIFFRLWGIVGIIPGLDVGLLCSVINLYLNMEANSFDDKKNEMCNEQVSIFRYQTLIHFIIAMVFAVIVNFIPF